MLLTAIPRWSILRIFISSSPLLPVMVLTVVARYFEPRRAGAFGLDFQTGIRV
jgi:hypothetical protein